MILLTVAGTLLALAAACGDDDDSEPADGAATPTPTTSVGAPDTSDNGDSPTLAPFSPGSGQGPEPSGRIAYYTFRDGNQEIYIMNVDGSDETNLTNHEDQDFEPDFSPDGEEIVFVSDRDGGAHLYIMNSDGSELRKLTSGQGGYLSPRWSPDGQTLAFSRSGTISVMNVDGTDIRPVFDPGRQETAPPCEGPGFVGGWSPDSQRITYYSASITRGIAEVCIIGVDGTGTQIIASDDVNTHAEPVWSPDGRYIAYRSIRAGRHEIFVVDLETGEETRVTDNPAIDTEPDWSPDGEWLAFAAFRENAGQNEDIYIMRKDGSDVRRLTDDPAMEKYPIWAP